jgi:hypothetical protein
VVFEAAPQVAGYKEGVDHVSFGFETRAGGHVFQFTIANALGTTYRQIRARRRAERRLVYWIQLVEEILLMTNTQRILAAGAPAF